MGLSSPSPAACQRISPGQRAHVCTPGAAVLTWEHLPAWNRTGSGQTPAIEGEGNAANKHPQPRPPNV